MKFPSTLFIFLVLAAELFAPLLAQAQGTLYLSNLGETPTGSNAVGSDSWLTAEFSTGTNSSGYYLNSVQLLMGAASGYPSNFTVSIFGNVRGLLGNSIGSLTGSLDPAAAGIFTYTNSGLFLYPSINYFIVLTAATSVKSGAYYWSSTDSSSFSSSDNWTGTGSNPFQFAIYATAAPEPSELALGALGALLLCFHRWCNSSR